jgi:hypothetical protein
VEALGLITSITLKKKKGVGAGGRNDPSLVCTYEKKKKKTEWKERKKGSMT